jgi:hypothetical protein
LINLYINISRLKIEERKHEDGSEIRFDEDLEENGTFSGCCA